MTRNHIGVDLSKDFLDICDPRRGEARVANQPRGDRPLARRPRPGRLRRLRGDQRLRPAAARRAPRGRPAARVRLNPLHAWHFARSLNLAKTDRVDAAHARPPRRRAAARAGPARRPGPRGAARARPAPRPAQAHGNPGEEPARRPPTLAARRPRHPRPSSPTSPAASAASRRRSPPMSPATPRSPRTSGCCARSPASARSPPPTLLAHLAELGRVDRRAIASLGGLAPRAHDSGRTRGRRFLGDGRRHVRRALYMAALSALRHAGFLADFVARMKAARKPAKVILMAVARRLLVDRQRHPSQPEPLPQPARTGMTPRISTVDPWQAR